MEAKPKNKVFDAVMEAFNYEKTLRAKSDKLRNEAFSVVEHRTKELSACDDSPVETKRLYTAEGKKAIDTLNAGFMSALMPQNSRWFGVGVTPRKYQMGQSPIEDLVYSSYVEKSMMNEFSHSNFYSQEKLSSLDTIIGGYSCMMVQEDPVTQRTNYTTFVPWRCWFDCDRFGNWDTFFYEYTLNGYEMLERFPNMPEKLEKDCRKMRSNNRYRMLFAIIDRTKLLDYNGKELSLVYNKNMRFASLQICLDSEDIVEESGYNDFPVVIHLWEQVSDSHYGIGLVMKYIAEFRKLSKLGYELGLTAEKINHRAWNVPEAIRESFSDDPRARNYYVTQDQIATPAEERPDVKSMEEIFSIQVDTVRRICYNDYMNFLTTHEQVYTATQVNQIKSESLAQIAPLSDNINTQKLLPVLKLTYVNMLNNRRIERPDTGVMAEVDSFGNRVNAVSFTFVSAMSEQLSMYSQLNASQTIAEQAQMWVQITQDPTVVTKNFKVNNILKVSARASGADADFIMTDEETMQIEQQMAQAQEQERQMAMMQQASEIDRNEAGASNLNNAMGANGGFQ